MYPSQVTEFCCFNRQLLALFVCVLLNLITSMLIEPKSEIRFENLIVVLTLQASLVSNHFQLWRLSLGSIQQDTNFKQEEIKKGCPLHMLLNILTQLLTQIIMPPKKRNLQKNQPTLNQLFEKQQSIEVGADHSKKIDLLVEKLLKVRADLETKRREEHKLLKQIVRLRIAEGPNREQPKEVEEEYWMMTTDQSLLNRNVSLFDLMLTQYGQTIINEQEQHKLRQLETNATHLKQEQQWKNQSILKQQYLQNYRAEFANVLKEFQYVADDACTTRI